MKQLATSLLLCLFMLTAAGQKSSKVKSPSQIAVYRIDSVIKKMMTDTSIELIFLKETGSKKDNYTITGAYKNGQLLMLHQGYIDFLNWGDSKSVYFENDKAVLYIEQHHNNSRMGSCGEISVTFYHYIKDSAAFAGMAKSVTSFYDCYGYKLIKPVKQTLFKEIDRLKALLNAKGNITISKAKPVSNLYIYPFFYTRDETVWESYGF